ncbi:CPBP family glutamic-type intramembrane protease [Flavobacterium sp. 3HN19-14]|uniref:CPBP family glutamic-type intramembrane protease n=1 Tax=Flavobacterium sp. 3HN19-14 TaxID=3448133 RepID=UPI003EE2C837
MDFRNPAYWLRYHHQCNWPFIIGTVFAVYYWKFRNIKILMICHFLWDFILLYMQSGRG